jgi:hypothetical protein
VPGGSGLLYPFITLLIPTWEKNLGAGGGGGLWFPVKLGMVGQLRKTHKGGCTNLLSLVTVLLLTGKDICFLMMRKSEEVGHGSNSTLLPSKHKALGSNPNSAWY